MPKLTQRPIRYGRSDSIYKKVSFLKKISKTPTPKHILAVSFI